MNVPLVDGCVKKLGTDSRACIQGFYLSVAYGTALQSVPNFFQAFTVAVLPEACLARC